MRIVQGNDALQTSTLVISNRYTLSFLKHLQEFTGPELNFMKCYLV